jgi:hypothetical protein
VEVLSKSLVVIAVSFFSSYYPRFKKSLTMKKIISIALLLSVITCCNTKEPKTPFGDYMDPLAKATPQHNRSILGDTLITDIPNRSLSVHQIVNPDYKTLQIHIETIIYDENALGLHIGLYNVDNDSYVLVEATVDTSQAEAEKKRQWELCFSKIATMRTSEKRKKDSADKVLAEHKRIEKLLDHYLTPYRGNGKP